MKRALFVTYGGGHVTMIAPVAKALQLQGIECHVLALTTGYRKAQLLGLNPRGYRDFQHLVPDLDRVLAWGQKLVPENSHPDVDTSESLAYLGINFSQWVHDHGEADAWNLYAEQGRLGFYPLNFMRLVLQDIEPDVVVTTNSNRSEEAAVEAAIELTIPSLSMVDLFLGASDPFCQRRLYADRLTVISEEVRQVLLSVGLPASRVVVTGSPAFDTLASETVRLQAQAFKRKLGWDNLNVVMFAGHKEEMPGTPAEWRGRLFCMEVETRLRDWLDDGDDRALIVRYHPSESHLYPKLASHPRMHRSEPSLESLHPLLLASNVVVVQASTVGLEASLSGRAVLCLTFAPSVRGTAYNYADLGLATAVDSMDNLIHALNQNKPLWHPDPDRFLLGRSTVAVSEEVLQLLSKK
jgi:hypothetical protein